MTIHGLAQYQPQMSAEFIMPDKLEVTLVIKAAHSDTQEIEVQFLML